MNDPEEIVSVGQDIEAKIIKVDAETHKIGLSLRAMNDDEVVYNLDEINNEESDTVTLGDMAEGMSDFRSALAEAVEAEREQVDAEEEEPEAKDADA